MLAFVTDATGQQGGAVANRLLADKVPVKALKQMPIEELAAINERFADGYRLLNKIKTPVIDAAVLRETHTDLLSFRDWLDRGGVAKIACVIGK